MEQFTLLEGDHTLKDSRELINNALLTVRSLSAGTAFPTTELSDGMLCYRTDLKRLYCLADAAAQVWTDKLPADLGGTAASAEAIRWENVTDKPTAYPAADHSHPYAGASTAGGAATSADKLTTPRTINQVAFDGTRDITLDIGVKTVNNTAPDANGNVTVSGIPVGTIIAFAANTDPDGCLICSGAAVSRSTYAELFSAIGTTYGEGDGSLTFNLPDFTDRFLMGSSAAGTVIDAGLPNITGSLCVEASLGHVPTGAFYSDGTCSGQAGGGGKDHVVRFDASRVSDIYGASSTVQPPAVTTRFYIKY